MGVQTAPCSWPTDFTDCANIEDIEGSGDPDLYIEMATEFLWNFTGRQYGLCEVTVRPCRQDCDDSVSTYWGGVPGSGFSWLWRPVIINGLWYNLGCGRCGDQCGCDHVESLQLPGPIHSVESISVDGAVLPSGNYRVDNGKYIIRTDGGAWPTCQHLDLPADQEGTWEVTYKRGVPVPVGGQVAAGRLASEFAKLLCGDKSCALPSRFRDISRQGVSIGAVLDTFDDLDEGRTGIWVIDSWVASVMKSPRRARVLSPDLKPKPRRTTWP